MTENEDSIVKTLLLGKPNSKNPFNKAILYASIEFFLSTETFNNLLFCVMLSKNYTFKFFLLFSLPGVFET